MFLKKLSSILKSRKVESVETSPENFQETLLKEYKSYWLYNDIEEDEQLILSKVKKFTMTSPERMLSLIRSTKYIIANNIAGDFVECGVWKGGMVMIIAIVLKDMGITDRMLYLYDTYEGMTKPSDNDISVNGNSAIEEYNRHLNKENEIIDWCYSSIDEVKENLYSTGYPKENFVFVKGKVEDTIPFTIPNKISLLRLDTDWFESTYHEMIHLYPKITKNGILIIDDYGHWKGAKKAVEKYIAENNLNIFFNRVDYSCRSAQII